MQRGPYEILTLLGEGGGGHVYRAWDPRQQREVALKVLRRRSEADPERVHRFIAEARAASALNHPNIVTVFDAAVDGDTPFIVSELIDGRTLREEIGRGPVPTKRTLDLEGGYAVTSRLTVRGLVGWQFRIKGPLAPELLGDWEHHDEFIVGNYFNAGGGTTISLTRKIDLYGVWISTLSGKNGAQAARSLAVGASWSFGGGFSGFGDVD